MTDQPFVSYAQNREDVVLWRALHGQTPGRYVEVGANDHTKHSISRAFYDRGWSGIEIEPVPALAAAFRESRPRDVVVEAAVTSEDRDEVVLHLIPDTGLSTLRDDVGAEHARSGWPVEEVSVPARRLDAVLDEHLEPGAEIHFLVVDTEGAERSVLESIDLRKWRPWVLVIEATAPMSDHRTHGEWEELVLRSGYRYCLFDGLSRWYFAEEHSELEASLDHPACVLDHFVTQRLHDAERDAADLRTANAGLTDQVIRWRGQVMRHWAAAAAGARLTGGGAPTQETARLRAELDQIHQTVSWRVTAPLRSVRTAQLRRSRRS